MSKVETIDALMESATLTFARDGYEGASLRDIAGAANVPLSTIHLYFGSKSELFLAVQQAAWNELHQERHALLLRAVAESGDAPPPLSDLVHALAYPVVRRALSKDSREIAQIKLMRGSRLHQLNPSMLEIADRSVTPWIEAMTKACAPLSRQDVIWAFSYVVGAIYSWQLFEHRYDTLLGDDVERTPEGVTEDIVAFCCSGIEAIVARRGS